MVVREYQESDRSWAEPFMQDEFGGPYQARRGQLIDVLALPGFVAEESGRPVGIVTYRRENDECELAFIGTLERHRGIGTALAWVAPSLDAKTSVSRCPDAHIGCPVTFQRSGGWFPGPPFG